LLLTCLDVTHTAFNTSARCHLLHIFFLTIPSPHSLPRAPLPWKKKPITMSGRRGVSRALSQSSRRAHTRREGGARPGRRSRPIAARTALSLAIPRGGAIVRVHLERSSLPV